MCNFQTAFIALQLEGNDDVCMMDAGIAVLSGVERSAFTSRRPT